MRHYGDITKLSGHELPIGDVITGGSPCQDLSVAGKRAGLAGKRSGLFMEQMRIVREMRERDETENGRTGFLCRPRFMVWENVPGAFSSGTPKGADFAAVIEEIIRVAEPEAVVSVCVPDGGWTKSGCYYAEDGSWSIAWRVHDAQFWGVPQRRKRISLVADFGGLCAPEILFERKGLSRHPEPCGTARERTAKRVENCTYPAIARTLTRRLCVGNGQLNNMSMAEQANTLDTMHDQQTVLVSAVDCRNGKENGEINGTLQAKSNGGTSVNLQNICRVRNVVRRLTPKECERLQGMPDDWSRWGVNEKGEVYELPDSARYRLQGNGIATPFWRWMLKRISAQYERTPTLGSLFDGQATFPMLWEGINGEGTALWSSEIEKHAAAVAKYHFPDTRTGTEIQAEEIG